MSPMEISSAIGAGAAAEVVGIDEVRADAFDLRDNVILANQRNGHDQHDAGAADNYAQHRQCGLYLVGAQASTPLPRFHC